MVGTERKKNKKQKTIKITQIQEKKKARQRFFFVIFQGIRYTAVAN